MPKTRRRYKRHQPYYDGNRCNWFSTHRQSSRRAVRHGNRKSRKKTRASKPRLLTATHVTELPKHESATRASACETVLRKAYPSLRVFRLSKSVRQALRVKFGETIPHSRRKTAPEGTPGLTYYELFRMLSIGFATKNKAQPNLVLLKGGCVRDIVQGKAMSEIHDIDLVHTKPYYAVKRSPSGLDANHVHYTDRRDKENHFHYIKVGDDDPANNAHAVDCTHSPLHISPYPLNKYEACVNTLFINVTYGRNGNEYGRVYDITGRGVADAVHRPHPVWRAPNDTTLRDPAWLLDAKLWRMLKFRRRGYTVDATTRRTVYRYWLDHYADAAPYNWINPLKKQFGSADPDPVTGKPPRPADGIRRAVGTLFTQLGDEFDTLDGFDAHDAVHIVRMLLEKQLLTVPSQFAYLQAQRQKARKKAFVKRAKANSPPANTAVSSPANTAVSSPANTAVSSPANTAVSSPANTAVSSPANTAVSSPANTKATGGGQSAAVTRKSHRSSNTPHTSSHRRSRKPTTSVHADASVHHPDVTRLLRRLRTYADAGCTATQLFSAALYLIDAALLTTFPIRTDVSDHRVHHEFKHTPAVDYPVQRPPLVGGTPLVFALRNDAACDAAKQLHQKLRKPIRGTSVTCADVLRTLHQLPRTQAYLSGKVVTELVREQFFESGVHTELLVVGADVDAVCTALGKDVCARGSAANSFVLGDDGVRGTCATTLGDALVIRATATGGEVLDGSGGAAFVAAKR